MYTVSHLQHTNSQFHAYLCMSIIPCRGFFPKDSLPSNLCTDTVLHLPSFFFHLPSQATFISRPLRIFTCAVLNLLPVLLYHSTIYPFLSPNLLFLLFYHLILLCSHSSLPSLTSFHMRESMMVCIRLLLIHTLLDFLFSRKFFVFFSNVRIPAV